ncbi:GNAT family N-acetyltransferase [Variovorax sp. J2P1-59]|uniref:GNAT family N-acetyltransferase n=1 Tax=Variovorax flavidus TaxID=3053501 RepID=UPI002576D56F|nr:GNAT family N-acetyltransferase [Variovorax sp. J2P1-59]MDM0078439.1 GNAT family N-acetyltransferase [Variovorax sp. J2P1-59]
MNFLMNSTTATSLVNLPSFYATTIEEWRSAPEDRGSNEIQVRPIQPDDFEREREFVERLSPRTAYQRLMSARKPSTEELMRWTHIDRSHEGAVVATVVIDGREQQVGVARYVVEDTQGEADFAIVIADEWQGSGLGIRLLSALIDLARQSGIKQLSGSTLSDNRGMLALARRLGFSLSKEAGAAIVTNLRLTLES